MSLTIPEAIFLAGRIGHVSARATALLVDDDTRSASDAAWEVIRAAVSKAGPKGLKVTKAERKAIVLSLFALLRSMSDVDTAEARVLTIELHDIALKIVEDVLD